MLGAVAVGLAVTSGVVEAQPATAAPAPPTRDWYGYQTLIVDTVACSLLVYSVVDFDAEAVYGAYAAYLLGAPIVHVAHLAPGPAIGSLIARFIVPFAFLGMLVLSTTGVDGDGTDSDVSPAYRWTLIGLGFGIPIGLDAALLAWEDRRAEVPALALRVDPKTSTTLIAVAGRL